MSRSKKKGYSAKEYRWLSGSRLSGYGMNERETSYFDGVSVEAVQNEVKVAYEDPNEK